MSGFDPLLHIVCTKMLKNMRIDQRPDVIDGVVQFIKFGLIGVSNTVLAYVINIVILWLISPYQIVWDYILGNLIAFVLSVAWSFYWNSRFVFQLQDKQLSTILQALLRTYVSYSLTGIILNNLLSWVWIEHLNISKYIAPLINLSVSVPLNFIINKFWAFSVKGA